MTVRPINPKAATILKEKVILDALNAQDHPVANVIENTPLSINKDKVLAEPNGERYWAMLEKDLRRYQALTQELADARGRIYALTEILSQLELEAEKNNVDTHPRRRRTAERLLLWIRTVLLPFK